VYWHDIEHLMDNYSLRPVPVTVPATNRMFAPATSTDTGLVISGKRKLASGRASFGAEWLTNDFATYQWNATSNAFNADILRDSKRDRLAVYGEWQGIISGAWSTNLGLRSDTVIMDTGNVRWGAVPLGVSTAGTAFNAASRAKTDHNLDWNALFQYAASGDFGYEIGLTRKTRSPSLLERYEWTPLSASAGQADGNNYLGNLNLKPEVAHALSAAVQSSANGHDFKLGAFYQRVSDYIVGTPFVTSAAYNASGHTRALQYQNHDARLYGLDGSWGYKAGAWQFSGILNYVRGRNLDNDTDLYRIAPLRLTLETSHQAGTWNNTLIARMASRQDNVATYDFSAFVGSSGPANNEKATPGYAVFDWHTQWRATKGVKVNFGIDNLLDKLYYDHLGGINRINCAGVAGCVSDVALNARLPSAGRFAFAQLEWTL
jgi:iron complex outermembrane receptor protein